ncbi:MAG: hypothetical protein H6603_08085 [Flavobacteriales bacterium]|nr:hypothetical protein [Flavobacteriales bacterium]
MDQLFEQPTFLFTWCTLLLLFAIVTVSVWFVGKQLLTEEQLNRVMLLTGSTFTAALLVEGLLRITGYTENYSEARLGHYNFICHGCYVNSLHVWPANEDHEIGDGVQFLYPRTTNSLGLSDREWTNEKPDSVYRIIALGDSFTEGDGAPADSSWPKLLEAQLQKEGKLMEVFNAGVCGSDPFFELTLFDQKLHAYEPDLAVFTIALQDIMEDIAVRGGMSRFNPGEKKHPKPMEFVYAYSHVARLVYNNLLGYSWQLVRHDNSFYREMIDERLPELFKYFKSIQDKYPKTEFILVYYPHLHSVTTEHYTPDITELENAIFNVSRTKGIKTVNLRNCYQDEIKNSRLPAERFWWKNDGHHNSDGYMMMADCIKNEMGL